MKRRWKVIRGDQEIGTFAAADIRQGLRDGKLDPFDQVAPEGSDDFHELIEVDEIFQIGSAEQEEHFGEAAQEKSIVSSIRKLMPAAKASSERSNLEASFEEAKPTNAARSQAQPQQISHDNQSHYYQRTAGQPAPKHSRAARSPGRSKSSPSSGARKSFAIINSAGKKMGPLSAREIIGLFNKGYLDQNVLVQKRGTNRTVPIKKFIDAYATKAPTKNVRNISNLIRSQNALNLRKMEALKSTAVQNFPKRSQSSQSFSIILLGLLVAALVFFVIDSRGLDDQPLPNIPAGADKNNTQTQPAAGQRPPENTGTGEDANTDKTNQGALPQPDPTRPGGAGGSATPKGQDKQATKPDNNANTWQKEADRRAKEREDRRKKAQEALRKQRAAEQIAKKALVQPKPKPQGSYLEAMVGKRVVTAPASFSRSALNSCKMKCRIFFRDSQGGAFTGVFFKAPYENVLKNRSTVTVMGTVQKSGNSYTIFVDGFK